MYVFGGGLVHPTTIMYFGSNENIAVGCLQWTLMSGILNCMLMLQTFLPFSSIIRFVFICYKRTVACTSLSNAWEVTGGKAVKSSVSPANHADSNRRVNLPIKCTWTFYNLLLPTTGFSLRMSAVEGQQAQILAPSADTEVIGTWPKTRTASNTVSRATVTRVSTLPPCTLLSI